jgi:hypothetical protein
MWVPDNPCAHLCMHYYGVLQTGRMVQLAFLLLCALCYVPYFLVTSCFFPLVVVLSHRELLFLVSCGMIYTQ